MALRTLRFEQDYERALGRTAQLMDAERNRVLCMEQLLLQFENDGLRLRFDQVNENLMTATNSESEIRIQLYGAYKEIERLRSIADTSIHEVEDLRRELSLMNDTATESKKLLSDKIRLSKDLSNVKSEFDRLSTQSASSKALLAEKQELERQLNTLRTQMENERRAHELMQTKGSHQTEEIINLSTRLDQARKELADETRARERQEWSARQQSAEWAAQRTALEGKLEVLNSKLRLTKDRLQGTQKDAQQQRSNARNDTSDSQPMPRTVSLQRATAQFHPDMTIATPGAVQTHDRIKKSAALPGDKSAFSITPFLNRTNGLANSPISSDDDVDELDTVNVNAEAKTSLLGNSSCLRDEGLDSQLQTSPLPEDLNFNAKKQSPRQFKSTAISTIGKPTKSLYHPDNGCQSEGSSIIPPQTSDHGQAKIKRRRLGTHRERSLFDEEGEDGEKGEGDTRNTKKPGRKLALGVGRNPVLSGLQHPGTGVSSRLPPNRGFGGSGFSPLKKDRKRF
ncbi:hypothetical protein AWENTII_009578 [Aspergillus wentii]|nr:hypothetical protein MW887_006768 [Aspergillus wentii]